MIRRKKIISLIGEYEKKLSKIENDLLELKIRYDSCPTLYREKIECLYISRIRCISIIDVLEDLLR